MTADTALQDRVIEWHDALRDRIHAELEKIEDEYAAARPGAGPAGRFARTQWPRPGGGGGTMGLLRGTVFEKAGVNVSTAWGEVSPELRGQLPGTESDARFWVNGLSLVVHPRSPLVPAVHLNTRHFRTAKAWWGGGTDLTPTYRDDSDTRDFHRTLEAACAAHDPGYYPRFKAWCDEYFFLKHRNEPRGVGGIFYDYHDSGDWERDFAFSRAVGEAFLAIYPALVRRHMLREWTEEQRQHQLVRRGRYVEFNLLYDRGTRFGVQTGANPEAFLMSLPPLAAWP
jgi:coproporphyrinogen III oxidase